MKDVSSFYDSNVTGKIRDFINGNDRVERAWDTILLMSPLSVRSILEVGCGIGYISWRMSQIWNQAKCTGVDISERSIDAAEKLFKHPCWNIDQVH